MSKPRRRHISMKQLLAAALGQLGGIPHEHRKAMTADQIISLFECNHDPIPVHIQEVNEHWNLQWMIRPEHRAVTAKKDVPEFAKGVRISEQHEEFRRRMLAKSGRETPEPKQKPRKGRKLQSQGFKRREKTNDSARGRRFGGVQRPRSPSSD